MNSETWRDFCDKAANQPGYVPKAARPLELKDFKCDRCGMVWRCGMKLEGEPHRALLNKCNGVWREYAAPSQPGSVVAHGSLPPPLKEEYEVDDTV